MRFFFRSRKFKILLSIFISLLILAGVLFSIGETVTPGSSVVAAITAPIGSAVNWVTGGITKFFKTFNEYDELAKQNDALRKENEALVSQLMEHQEALKEFLEIKEKNKDYIMEPATIIARDVNDAYGGFTVGKGSLDGVAVGDPVITSAGLIGYIGEVGLSYSKVTTIMSSFANVSAIDRRTSDVGVVGGTVELAQKGNCRMFNISNNSSVAVGDYVVTAGGGMYPEGIVIGKIVSIMSDELSISLIAEIQPVADITEAENVMIITYFAGQGISGPED